MVPASQPIHRSLDSVTQASTRRPAEPIVRRGGLHGHGGPVARPRGGEGRPAGGPPGPGPPRAQPRGPGGDPRPAVEPAPAPPPAPPPRDGAPPATDPAPRTG